VWRVARAMPNAAAKAAAAHSPLAPTSLSTVK
jgi:pyrroline-5-carboxylate reductase